MNTLKNREGTQLTVALEGRLDTLSAPVLETELNAEIKEITTLIFDLSGLDYLSSAGLRVLLTAQKTMNRQGTMAVRNVKPNVMEIFEITGFIDLLNIEE